MKRVIVKYSIPIEQNNEMINNLGSETLSKIVKKELASNFVNELIETDQLYIKRSCDDNQNLVYQSDLFIIDEVSLMKLKSIITDNISNHLTHSICSEIMKILNLK